jgi:hypothetical protein
MSALHEAYESVARELERCALFMRGMSMDPSIPPHAIEALLSCVDRAETVALNAINKVESE